MADKPSFLEKIKAGISNAVTNARSAIQRFNLLARQLKNKRVDDKQLVRSEPNNMIHQVQPVHLGRMMMFFYDPKWKQKLPYYDRFPLIIPLEIYPDGFLGLNLHYLPPMERARLMDALYRTIYPDREKIDEKTRIRITYQLVKRVSRNRLFKPCVKRYLYGHLKSRIFVVPPTEWDVALFLPTQRFTKASDSTVWRESMQQTRG